MTQEELTFEWLKFKQGWYQDEGTEFWYRDYEGCRFCIVGDKKTGDWAYSFLNWETRVRQSNGPFSTRQACARNAFAQLMLFLDRVDAEVAQQWLVLMKQADQATQEI